MVRSSSNTASTSDLKHPSPAFKDHKNWISFDAWITDHENNMYAFDNLVHCFADLGKVLLHPTFGAEPQYSVVGNMPSILCPLENPFL